MNILEVNRQTLANLYEQFPESFKGLRIEGNYLAFGREYCDISHFNIYDLIEGNSNFAANLENLTAEDIFRIIRLHTLSLESKFTKDDNQERLEAIKQEDPLLKYVTIVPKNERTGKDEIINIVDSAGRDNVFVNTYNIDFFELYADVKAKVGGTVTPEDLIQEIDRRIYGVDLQSAESIDRKSDVSEDFSNKMRNVNDPYDDNSHINVYGNEQMDMAVVADAHNNDRHEIVTFDRNEFGDTVVEKHVQDIRGSETVEDNSVTSFDTEQDDKTEKDTMEPETVEEEIIPLMSEEEFYRLLGEARELSAGERRDLDTYYAFLGELMTYEDYLLPDLTRVLANFRNYIYEVREKMNEDDTLVTNNQKEASEKEAELTDKVQQVQQDKVVNEEMDFNKSEVGQRVLKLENRYKNSSEGFVSTFAIIGCIVFVSIIMTIITLYLIK